MKMEVAYTYYSYLCIIATPVPRIVSEKLSYCCMYDIHIVIHIFLKSMFIKVCWLNKYEGITVLQKKYFKVFYIKCSSVLQKLCMSYVGSHYKPQGI